LDENGEPLSKNALKKLLKKEAADKKKAEKAAARVSSQYTSFNYVIDYLSFLILYAVNLLIACIAIQFCV